MKKRRGLFSFIKNIYELIMDFLTELSNDHVSAFAGQSCYFFMTAIFPFTMLLLTLLKFTPITEDFLITVAVDVLPSSFEEIGISTIKGLYENNGTVVISFSIIATIWSSSKGIYSIMLGLNSIYHIEKQKNYFIKRFFALLYTFCFIIGIIITLAILVFGNTFLGIIRNSNETLYNILSYIFSLRGIYIPFILTFLFILLYKTVPNKNFRFINHLPGAIFSALGWEVFSIAYSVYVDYYMISNYVYGSITVIILMLLWLYICMYILFIGAEMNVFINDLLTDKEHPIKATIRKKLEAMNLLKNQN